ARGLCSGRGGLLAAAGGESAQLGAPGADAPGATLRSRGGTPRDFAFSADGRTIAAAADNGTVQRWSVSSGQELAPLRAHAGTVHTLAFSGDGRLLATAGEDGTLKVGRAAGAQEAPTFSHPLHDVPVLARREALARSQVRNNLRQIGLALHNDPWGPMAVDVRFATLPGRFSGNPLADQQDNPLSFSADGKDLVVNWPGKEMPAQLLPD